LVVIIRARIKGSINGVVVMTKYLLSQQILHYPSKHEHKYMTFKINLTIYSYYKSYYSIETIATMYEFLTVKYIQIV